MSETPKCKQCGHEFYGSWSGMCVTCDSLYRDCIASPAPHDAELSRLRAENERLSKPMPCGHPIGAVYSSGEGTNHCGWCRLDAAFDAAKADAEKLYGDKCKLVEQRDKLIGHTARLEADLAAMTARAEAAEGIVAAINELRGEEGSILEIYCDNPDFGGHNCAVGVIADWTEDAYKRIGGDSFADALSNAVKAKAAAERSSK